MLQNSILQCQPPNSKTLNRKGRLQNRIIEMHTGKAAFHRPQVILSWIYQNWLIHVYDSPDTWMSPFHIAAIHCTEWLKERAEVRGNGMLMAWRDMNLMPEHREEDWSEGGGAHECHSWRQGDMGTLILLQRSLSLHFQESPRPGGNIW